VEEDIIIIIKKERIYESKANKHNPLVLARVKVGRQNRKNEEDRNIWLEIHGIVFEWREPR